MRLKSEFKLVGAQPMKFDSYDVTQIFLELPLTNGNGFSTVKHDFDTSTYYEKNLKDIELPCQIIVDFELVSTGKAQKTIIHGLEVLKKSNTVNQQKTEIKQG